MILIAMGANQPSLVGDPESTFLAAIKALQQMGVGCISRSFLYQTPALTYSHRPQPDYVNAVICVRSVMPPRRLMALLHALEARFGRRRRVKWEARGLDLDLLDYHGKILTMGPVLPHPHLAVRGFVLYPLRDIAPGWRHPHTQKSVDALICRLGAVARFGIRRMKKLGSGS